MKYTPEQIKQAVANSRSWVEVADVLAAPSIPYIARRANDLGIDHSHFVGSAWNKGHMRAVSSIQTWIDSCCNVKNRTQRHHLIKKKLFNLGFKSPECEQCAHAEWLGVNLPLHLDHKDGHSSNYQFDNLQILCPNCHAVKTAIDLGYEATRGTRQSGHCVKPKLAPWTCPKCGTKTMASAPSAWRAKKAGTVCAICRTPHTRVIPKFTYTLETPDGVMVTSVNLNEFCKTHNLKRTTLQAGQSCGWRLLAKEPFDATMSH